MADKAVDDWMAFYVGKYLADTMHLAREHHGSYLLLIMAAFKNAGWLPNDDGFLATIAKCTTKEWKAERVIYARFFVVTDERWTHEKVTKEWEKAQSLSQDRSKAGRKGAAKRWQGHRQNDAPTQSQSPSQSVTPTESVANSASHIGRARFVSDWEPSEDDIAAMRTERPDLVGPLYDARMRDFRDWCAEKAATSFNPAATWRAFMRKTKAGNPSLETFDQRRIREGKEALLKA